MGSNAAEVATSAPPDQLHADFLSDFSLFPVTLITYFNGLNYNAHN